MLCDLGPICKASDVYNLFLDDDELNTIVETNRQTLRYKNTWINTNPVKVKQFLGVVMYTGLVSYPKISDYWSRQTFFHNKLISKIMPRKKDFKSY